MKTGLQDKIYLIVRADDFGMSHACNVAIEKCFEEGILTCAGILAVAPWFEEAVNDARKNPSWRIGVHLSVTGEWKGYSWRPVLPYNRVPSLVDKYGFLYKSPKDFFAAKPDYNQLEKEFCAQVELVSKKYGRKLSYLDTHYIAGDSPKYRKFMEVVKAVAGKFNLPISGWCNEQFVSPGIYKIDPDKKETALAGQLEKLTPGVWLLVTHLLVKSIDSAVLVHSDPRDVMPQGVGNLRNAETGCLISRRIKDIIKKRDIQLISYPVVTL